MRIVDENALPFAARERLKGKTMSPAETHPSPAVGAPLRKDTHVTHAQAPVRPGITPQTTATMPRAEDDEATRAQSFEFHDRPGSGRDTAHKGEYF